jgi:NitT/TauT family transport system substrate-binding protein
MRLTPLGKGVALILVAGLAYGGWQYWKKMDGGDGSGNGGSNGGVPGRDRPLRVGIVTWPGYAGGIMANDGFKPNPDSIYGRNHNLKVEFTLQEDIDVRNKLFAKGGKDGLDIVWSTVDFWANELPGLRETINAKAIMQVDWSQGGDAIVAADPNISSIEDLRGKKIALAQFTPSHWLLEYSLSNSSLTDAAQREVYNNLVFKTASPDALADYVAGKVDAAVVWEPDVEASQRRSGSHIITSTRTATNIIADIMVAREDLIKNHPDVVKGFVQGWLEGTIAANREPDRVVKLLMENEPVYKDLGAERTKRTLPTVKWADMADNARMFGLDGSQPFFDKIFAEAGKSWNKRGYIKTAVPAAEAKDDRFLRELYPLMKPAELPEPCGPKPKGQPAAGASLTKLVDIKFDTGSAELDSVAKKTIDDQIVLLAETHGGAFIGVEGNTDNTGDMAVNLALSKRRADAVVAYLAERYRCHQERFITKGNGPNKPVANNATTEGRAQNRRTDIVIIPAR